jgi:hypothetical protein
MTKFNLPEWIDKDAWEGYVQMRRSIKKPLTPYAMKLAVSKLAALKEQGHNPKAVLEQSIFNSWQGLFPLKDRSSAVAGQEPAWAKKLETFQASLKENTH